MVLCNAEQYITKRPSRVDNTLKLHLAINGKRVLMATNTVVDRNTVSIRHCNGSHQCSICLFCNRIFDSELGLTDSHSYHVCMASSAHLRTHNISSTSVLLESSAAHAGRRDSVYATDISVAVSLKLQTSA